MFISIFTHFMRFLFDIHTFEFSIENVLETYLTKVSKKNIRISEKIKKNGLNKNLINIHTCMHVQVGIL